MSTIYVKTTDTCNLNCDHCFTNGKNGIKTEWDWKQTAHWIQERISQTTEHTHLELHGGEPMLVPLDTLKAFCREFKDMEHVSLGVTTNLVYRLTDDHLDFFKHVLSNRIGTSWDRGVRFDNAKQLQLWEANVRRVRQADIEVLLMVSITQSLMDYDQTEFVRYVADLGIAEVTLERLTSSGSAVANPLIFPDPDVQDRWYLSLLKRYQAGEVPFSIRDFDILIERLKYNVTSTYTNCRDCEQTLVTISADGHLSGCPNTALEVHQGTIMDKASELDYHDGRIESITKELTLPTSCLECEVFDVCGGDCHQLGKRNGRCGGLYHVLRYLTKGLEPDSPTTIQRRVIPIMSQL